MRVRHSDPDPPAWYNRLERRGVAQPGSASALGAEGRGFESLRPDQHRLLIIKAILTISATHLLLPLLLYRRDCSACCTRRNQERKAQQMGENLQLRSA